MVAVAWAAFGLLAGSLLGGVFYLGSRIDALSTRIDALDERLSSRLDALASRLDFHVERHAG